MHDVEAGVDPEIVACLVEFGASITSPSSAGTLAGKAFRLSSVAANSSFHSANNATTMITVMKFQSLIAPIMHGHRLAARAALDSGLGLNIARNGFAA